MKRPRVALVEAASSSTHVYSRSYRPRVGIPTMGAVLRDLGYECDLWFQSLPGMKEQRLRRYDIVGIGSLTNTMPEAYRLADSLLLRPRCSKALRSRIAKQSERGASASDAVVKNAPMIEGGASAPPRAVALRRAGASRKSTRPGRPLGPSLESVRTTYAASG